METGRDGAETTHGNKDKEKKTRCESYFILYTSVYIIDVLPLFSFHIALERHAAEPSCHGVGDEWVVNNPFPWIYFSF